MIVGACQFRPVFGDKKGNLALCEKLLERSDAALVVLPELFATGYQFVDRAEAAKLAETENGLTLRWAKRLAKKKKFFLCGGFAESAGKKIFNSAFLVGPKGLVGIYRKIHLFARETIVFDPGDRPFQVYDIGCAKVGMMVCFDWIFPESMRTLALLGAQIVAHPSNLVLPFCQDAMVTRCLENKVFSITANRYGVEKRVPGEKLAFSGMSQITGPRGAWLKRVSPTYKGVAAADIAPELALNKSVTDYNDIFEDRRVSMYDPITRGRR